MDPWIKDRTNPIFLLLSDRIIEQKGILRQTAFGRANIFIFISLPDPFNIPYPIMFLQNEKPSSNLFSKEVTRAIGPDCIVDWKIYAYPFDSRCDGNIAIPNGPSLFYFSPLSDANGCGNKICHPLSLSRVQGEQALCSLSRP